MDEPNLIAQRRQLAFVKSDLERDKPSQIAFHMTDWLEDLVVLQKLYSNIGETNDERLQSTLIQFLAHVPDHLAAAKKLIGLGPVTDVFGIGALDEDE